MSSRIRAGEEDSSEEESGDETQATPASPAPTPASAPAAAPQSAHRHGEESEEDDEDDDRDDKDAAAGGGITTSFTNAVSSPLKASSSSLPSTDGSAAFFALLSPALSSITSRLVELQEAQHMLVTTVSVQRSEGIVGASDWTTSRDICDAIPAYLAKIQKIKKTMATAQAMVQKTERASDNLRRKLEEREKERIAKRRADASGYSSVSAK